MSKPPFDKSMPLTSAIYAYTGRLPFRWHVPGHKGSPPYTEWEDMAGAYMIDVTELPGLDDLHHPLGPIAEAERRAALFFGADATMFLVNGSTVGNIAMLLSVCRRGDAVVVPRNCHKSVFHALVLGGLRPVYLPVQWGAEFCVSTWPTLEALDRALDEDPSIKAVLLTYPTYYGLCMPLQEYADVIHRHGKILLVDEAHGAHFRLHDNLPAPALACGADACVQSSHKTLGSLTQSAMLHVKGDRVDVERVRRILAVLETSSPSYPLMASLDFARAFAEAQGAERVQAQLPLLQHLRDGISAVPGLRCFGPHDANRLQCSYDPFKLLVSTQGSGLSAKEWYDRLSQEHGHWLELSGFGHILAVAGIGQEEEQFESLLEAMANLARSKSLYGSQSGGILNEQALARTATRIPHMGMLPADAFYCPVERVAATKASGLLAGAAIVPYPPGIPLLFPGERIEGDHLELIISMVDNGFAVHGIFEEDTSEISIPVLIP